MTMFCDCGKKMKCIDSRQRNDNSVWRRHGCECGISFTTIETRDVESSVYGRGKAIKIKTSITDTEIERISKLLDDAVTALSDLTQK